MIVEVRQTPDQSAASIGLDKHHKSKLPGVFETVQPAKGYDGRWITGIDEEASTINSIKNVELREKIKEETLQRRKDLEQITNLDLRATNDAFWEKYKITLRDNVTLNLTNPQDKLKYHVLVSNGYAAPELGVLNAPEYYGTKYYISRKEEETADKMTTVKRKDKARAGLLKLSENKFKLVIIGKYLIGDRIKEEMSIDAIYNELSNYIDNPQDSSNVKAFLEAIEKNIEDLQYKLVIDKAIKSRVILVRDGYYQRGNATYGKSLKETIEFLSKLENANEFASLKEEVEGK